MNTKVMQTELELVAVKTSIELLSKSTNAQDLCRRIAHSDLMQGLCQGVEVFLLDQRSVLLSIASYGRCFDFGAEEISTWDDTLLSNAVKTRKYAVHNDGEVTVFAWPIQHDDVATGVFAVNMIGAVEEPSLSDEILTMLSNLGGLFMHSNGFSKKPGVSSVSGDDGSIAYDELTSRQVTVLTLIAEGCTNAEIAKQVLLSESTVRQETIRIYRILKCHTRAEAIVKARANGIIPPVS